MSLAATYTDLTQHSKAVEHYKEELTLRQGSPTEVKSHHQFATVINTQCVVSAYDYFILKAFFFVGTTGFAIIFHT